MVIGFSTTLISAAEWFQGSLLLDPHVPGARNVGQYGALHRALDTFSYAGDADPWLVLAAQAALVVAALSFVLTLVLGFWHDARAVVRKLRQQRGPQLDLQFARLDASFWQVGDRVGWYGDDNKVRTGVITETHRRPFAFGGKRFKGYAGAPGTVTVDDETNERTAHDFGTVYRIALGDRGFAR